MTTPVLYLSGAGLPAWIWNDVRAELGGDSVVATYPGSRAARLDDYVDAALGQAPETPFVLVAHSVGGVVATGLLARESGRVAALVGVSACFPAPGSSFFSSMPFPQRLVLPLLTRLAGTRPPANEIREGLCAGVDREVADRIVAEFSPEARALYSDRVAHASIPDRTAYVVTEHDTQLAPSLQERFAARLGSPEVHRLPTAHLPMLQEPGSLARIVEQVRASLRP